MEDTVRVGNLEQVVRLATEVWKLAQEGVRPDEVKQLFFSDSQLLTSKATACKKSGSAQLSAEMRAQTATKEDNVNAHTELDKSAKMRKEVTSDDFPYNL
jgi:hypothetical protein